MWAIGRAVATVSEFVCSCVADHTRIFTHPNKAVNTFIIISHLSWITLTLHRDASSANTNSPTYRTRLHYSEKGLITFLSIRAAAAAMRGVIIRVDLCARSCGCVSVQANHHHNHHHHLHHHLIIFVSHTKQEFRSAVGRF